MKDGLRILIVDDEELYRDRLQLALKRLPCIEEVREAGDSQSALRLLEPFRPDVVLLDLKLDAGDRRGQSGEALLRALVKRDPAPAVVIVTQLEDEGLIEGIRKDGAIRHVSKPITDEKLAWALAPIFKRRGEDLAGLVPPLPGDVREAIRRAAPFNIPVLVRGPTGAGKELVARELHNQSRRSGEFVAVQLDALPERLLEGELFGWVRGAHSEARSDREGLLERAAGGTLFLDEIGELPPELQCKLLRVLQEKRVRRLGEGRERAVDFRLVVATNRDPQEAIAEGRLREDLYFRFAGRTITLPPLRERLDDLDSIVPNLLRRSEVKYGLGRVFAVSKPAMEKLRGYPWPGNVRELDAVLENALIDASAESEADALTSVILRAEHVRLPDGTHRRQGRLPTDTGLAADLSRRCSVFDNLRAVSQNQVKVLEGEGLKWPEITRIMGISRATYFRIKAGRWPPGSHGGDGEGA